MTDSLRHRQSLVDVKTTEQLKTFGLNIDYLVRALVKFNASDLHLKVGRPPLFRVNGRLIPSKMRILSQNEIETIMHGVLNSLQIEELHQKKQLDFSFRAANLGRFRCNVYYQKNTLSAAIRMISDVLPKIDELGLPPVVKELCHKTRGLILLAGSTGCGKSTTLGGMLQYINENKHVHILTIEDPIEFVYRDAKASITQREVGSDTLTAQDALLAGLRQDPDIIMLGEIRSPEMIQVALTAAETGHLVITTLHSNDAKSTIDRILDIFRGEHQNQVRIQLASSLVAVISQQLVLRADGKGQIPVCEVMIKSPAIEGYLFRNELERIPEAISMSKTYYQMQTMNQALYELVQNQMITQEEALKSSYSPDDLKLIIAGLHRDSL